MAVDHDPQRLLRLRESFEEFSEFSCSLGFREGLDRLKAAGRADVFIFSLNGGARAPMEVLRSVHEVLKDASSTVRVVLSDGVPEDALRESPFIGVDDLVCCGEIDPQGLALQVRTILLRRAKERRSSLRVSLPSEREIVVEVESDGIARAENLSETGMFLRTEALLAPGTLRGFTLRMPDVSPRRVDGHVVRADRAAGGVGVRFAGLSQSARDEIFGVLADLVLHNDLADLKRKYAFLKTSEMIAFRSEEKIESLLGQARETQAELTALAPLARAPIALSLKDTRLGRICILGGRELDVRFKTGDSLFLSFQLGYATYNFESTVRRIAPDGTSMECFYPRVMFYSEKRALRRDAPLVPYTLEILLPAPFGKVLRGPVSDISEGGASFVPPGEGPILLPGTPLDSIRVLQGDRVVREGRGEVRYASLTDGDAPGPLKYGLQFGIGRMNIHAVKTLADESGAVRIAAFRKGGAAGLRRPSDVEEFVRRPPDVIRLENGKGEEIVGLLNTSLPLDDDPVPVVLVPPAFGKTKETLFGLALTLAENFWVLDKPLAVLRFDGIRRKGESFKDPRARFPKYETIDATFTQAADDIRAILDWLDHNPRLKAGPVILVTFSLSALEARIILKDEAYRRRIHYWISGMGAPEFRHLMIRVNCGLDFLEHYQLGIPLDVMPILGNLVDVDPYVADGVANGVATLEQAREDMRHIDIPVTWIYGEHDHWVRGEFIRDIMSVRAPAPREVIAVPGGHSARTSEEALQLFGTIASLVHRFLHKDMIQPIQPSKPEMEIVRRAEKDRLPSRTLEGRKEYWQRYLVGEQNRIGFDIMTMSDDYLRLMRDQNEALDLRPSDRVLDLGGGTGNFLELLLESGAPLPSRVTIADLVPEAMALARRKLAPGLASRDGTFLLETVCCDIELSRYLPVLRFLDGEIGRFRDLVDRIENLPLQSAEKIQADYSPRLHRILRGAEMSGDDERWLKGRFELAELRAIGDFNRAARHLRGTDAETQEYRMLSFPGGTEANLHLPFRAGSFDKILMSLVLSYIFDPVETLRELRRIARPGARLVLSSMRPDTDASGLFTRLVEKIETLPSEALPSQWTKTVLLDSIRAFLNDAQALVELEEAGTFDFFDPEKLDGLLEDAGWERTRMIPSFGTPPQGYVVVARGRASHD